MLRLHVFPGRRQRRQAPQHDTEGKHVRARAEAPARARGDHLGRVEQAVSQTEAGLSSRVRTRDGPFFRGRSFFDAVAVVLLPRAPRGSRRVLAGSSGAH